MPASGELERLAWRLRWRLGPRVASRARIAVAKATNRHATVSIPRSVHAGPGFRLEIPGRGTLVVGEDVQFRRAFYCEITDDAVVTIGAGTQFAGDTTIQCSSRIEIGERSMIGDCVIADGAHQFRDWTRPSYEQGYTLRHVVIGPEAVVHNYVTIVANIGYRAVVAANSLVNRDVPDYTLVGGVPAKVLEYFGPPHGNGPPDA